MIVTKEIKNTAISPIIELIGGCSLHRGPWIAGGAARRLWYDLPHDNHDIDFFFSSLESYETVKNKLETKLFQRPVSNSKNEWNWDVIADIPLEKIIFRSNNAITYKINMNNIDYRVQIINKKWHNSVSDLWKGFDLNACKFVTDGQIILADNVAVSDCNDKILQKNLETTQDLSAKRILKYCMYGFTPSKAIMTEIINQYRNNTMVSDDY